MAKLIYDKNGRLLFTKEMKKEYTLLVPQMLPIHFSMIVEILKGANYNVEMLTSNHAGIVGTGLKYVHNDACYPALLVIGQLIDAVNSGKYDKNKVALVITQTGGGCRASNYIHLLRKALKRAGLEFVPVISLNLSGLEKNPGFTLTLPLMIQAVFALIYGDLIMNLSNQVKPYELTLGQTDSLTKTWQSKMVKLMQKNKGFTFKSMAQIFENIVADYEKIPVSNDKKAKVGVVGEIYIKYSALGNNCLEDFLISSGAEPVVPGIIDFILFKFHNRDADVSLYGGKKLKQFVVRLAMKFMKRCQNELISALNRSGRFTAPNKFEDLRELVSGYLGEGNKMGEGWLLTAEMLELIHSGVPNIICVQPFGCLPNHIVGKGMVRKIKTEHPYANIVAIDYDPGASKVNQENRIKLMLAQIKTEKP